MLNNWEKENPRQAITKMMRLSYKNIRLEQCPFYRNQLGCSIYKHGNFKFYVKGNSIVTCVVVQRGKEDNWRY